MGVGIKWRISAFFYDLAKKSAPIAPFPPYEPYRNEAATPISRKTIYARASGGSTYIYFQTRTCLMGEWVQWVQWVQTLAHGDFHGLHSFLLPTSNNS